MAQRLAGKPDTAIEDYALRRVPATWTWPWRGVVSAILGAGTAMFFLDFGGALAAAYGTINTLIAAAYAVVVQGLLSYVLVNQSTRYGLNIDLLSRGLGLGYMGSAITSIIYAVNFIMYFAIEGEIMGGGIHQFTHIPLDVSYLIVGAGFIPLTLYGMRFMARFQTWSLPLYIILLGAGVFSAVSNPVMLHHANGWLTYMPTGARLGGTSLLGAMGAMNGLVGIIVLLINDFARFAPKNDSDSRRSFWGRVVVAFFPENAMTYLVGVPLGIFLSRATGTINPGVYMVTMLGVGGLIFVLLTQIRINITNVYSGSLALANFFSRATQFIPGRKFWVYTMIVVSTVALFTNVLNYVNQILTFQGVFLLAWVGSLMADILVVKGLLHLGPNYIEYRRAYLPAINWIGLSSIIAGSLVGSVFAFGPSVGYFTGPTGTVLSSIAGWIAIVVAFGTHIAVAVGVKGRGYVVRPAQAYPGVEEPIRCIRCSEIVDRDDLAQCPFHQGQWICAHCCMSEKHCNTLCQSSQLLTLQRETLSQ